MRNGKLGGEPVILIEGVVLFTYLMCGIMLAKLFGREMTTGKETTEAVKVEDKQLRDYELVLIISPELVDEALEGMIENVSRFITRRGGAISNVEQWGKRKLAYPIGHFMEGNYILTQFKLKPELTKELETNLRISEKILRHLLIKLDS